MGSTVSTGKAAFAFRTPANKAAYVLYEEAYEKNCHPHRPHWSPVALGYLDEVLDDVFRFASSCEGQMLQHRSSAVLPETYIVGWLHALAAPLHMRDYTGRLAYGDNYAATLPLGHKLAIEESLQEHGLGHEVATIEGRDVSLYRDFDLLRAIYGKRNPGLWRLLRERMPESVPAEANLAYTDSMTHRSSALVPPPMYRAGDENVIMADETGCYRCAGWAYSVVGSFISSYGPIERQAPGTYKHAIKTYRSAVTAAAQLARDTRILVVMNHALEPYQQEATQRVIDVFEKGARRIDVTLGQMRDQEKAGASHLLYHLLGDRSATWFPSTEDIKGGEQACLV